MIPYKYDEGKCVHCGREAAWVGQLRSSTKYGYLCHNCLSDAKNILNGAYITKHIPKGINGLSTCSGKLISVQGQLFGVDSHTIECGLCKNRYTRHSQIALTHCPFCGAKVRLPKEIIDESKTNSSRSTLAIC